MIRISKVYKSNNFLIVRIPYEVVEGLNIKPGDEVDFFSYKNKYYIFAKKSDITKILTGDEVAPRPTAARPQARPSQSQPTEEELSALKKLDTIRYNERTREKSESVMTQGEKQALQSSIKKGYVVPFKDPKTGTIKYSITKWIYDEFLMRKRPGQQTAQQPGARAPASAAPQGSVQHAPDAGSQNQYITNLHKYGYAVIPTEAEASEVSLMIEDEIRHGIVMGTRAFNKKFYIATKNFIIKNTTKLLNLIRTKPMGVGDIAAAAELNPEGARAILYILSESGEVTEVRKDIFKAV